MDPRASLARARIRAIRMVVSAVGVPLDASGLRASYVRVLRCRVDPGSKEVVFPEELSDGRSIARELGVPEGDDRLSLGAGER